MTAAYFVGLDVHSRQPVFVVQDAAGEVIERGSLSTERAALAELVARHRLAERGLVGLETGNSAFFVAEILMDLGVATHVIDAHEVRRLARRATQKSDSRDAFEICDGLRRGIFASRVTVPPRWGRELRELLARRRHFVRAAVAEVHAAKLLVRSAGLPALVRGSLRTAKGWQQLERGLQAQAAPALLRELLATHYAAWQALRAQVGRLETLLDARAAALAPAQQAALRRLDGIPSFGRIVSHTLLAVVIDAKRFPSAKHVGSYAGFAPMTWQSGDQDRHGHITRRGSSELRAMLCEAAHCCRRVSHPLHPYFRKLVARRGYKIATVAVAHRLLRIAWRLLRDEVDFDVRKLGVEAGPFEQTITHHWRLKKPPAQSGQAAS